MSRRLLRVLRLPPAEQFGLLRLLLLRIAIEPLLASMPLPRLASMLGIRFSGAAQPVAPRLPADRLSERDRRAVAAANRLTLRGRNRDRRCLRHALLTGHVLRRHDPILRIGAAKKDDAVQAHAWIECLGGRIDTDEAAAYRPLRNANSA